MRIYVAMKGFSTCTDNEIVASRSKRGLSKAIGISESGLKRDLSNYVTVKGWNVIEVELISNKSRGRGY